MKDLWYNFEASNIFEETLKFSHKIFDADCSLYRAGTSRAYTKFSFLEKEAREDLFCRIAKAIKGNAPVDGAVLRLLISP